MAAEAYYVRARGKVTGPFDLNALQKLVRRGLLARAHEISSDRASWASAGDFGELFGARESTTAVAPTSQPKPAAVPTSASTVGQYFYVQNGITVGPVPVSVLISLAQSGTLRREDFCWQEGSEMALPASHVPALAPVFSAGAVLGETRTPHSMPSHLDKVRASQALNSTSSLAQVTGIVAGCAMLLFLNLPLGATRLRTLWWWDSLDQSDAQSVVVLCFFVLLAGIASAGVGMFVKGLVRAWIFLGISALSLILIFVAVENQLSAGAELFFTLACFYLAAALIGSSYFRSKSPDTRIGMIFQPTFAGAMLLSVLLLTILGLARTSSTHEEMFGGRSLPGWAVLVITVAVVGSVAATVSGILGLTGVRRRISRNVNGSILGFAIASIALPFIAAMIWISEFVSTADVDQKGMWVFAAFRICGIFIAFLALLAVGLIETFVCLHFSTPVSQNQPGS